MFFSNTISLIFNGLKNSVRIVDHRNLIGAILGNELGLGNGKLCRMLFVGFIVFIVSLGKGARKKINLKQKLSPKI